MSQEFDGLLIGRQRVVFDSPSDLPAGIASPTESPSHYFNSVVAPKDTICQLGGFNPSLPFGQDVGLVVRARRTGFHVQLVDEVTTIRHITGGDDPSPEAEVDFERYEGPVSAAE